MPCHAAIVCPRVADALVAGTKRLESRLMRRRRPPFDCVRAGDRVYFKLSGGPWIGRATVQRVLQLAGLRPADVRGLRRRYGARILAPPAYWRGRLRARYAVLIWLRGWTSAAAAPALPRQYGSAWVTMGPGAELTRRAPHLTMAESTRRSRADGRAAAAHRGHAHRSRLAAPKAGARRAAVSRR
ncbi:MAG: ASCH domain-containing protein [Phycisphaerae bacterium]|nr:ASCH domain-containing protein [Phycisphaerae bacterium]MCZ2401112.1 ASCH domain-containing protein [Phycisphaerae bacterium]